MIAVSTSDPTCSSTAGTTGPTVSGPGSGGACGARATVRGSVTRSLDPRRRRRPAGSQARLPTRRSEEPRSWGSSALRSSSRWSGSWPSSSSAPPRGTGSPARASAVATCCWGSSCRCSWSLPRSTAGAAPDRPGPRAARRPRRAGAARVLQRVRHLPGAPHPERPGHHLDVVLSVGPATLVSDRTTDDPVVVAASLLAKAPVLAPFVLLQRRVVDGPAGSGLKWAAGAGARRLPS